MDSDRQAFKLSVAAAMMLEESTLNVVSAVMAERRHQDILHGRSVLLTNDRGRWWDILLEELGEFGRAMQEGTAVHARVELVQAAAVLCSMIEAGDLTNWWGMQGEWPQRKDGDPVVILKVKENYAES